MAGPCVYRPDHPLANENGMVPKHLAGEPRTARSRLPGPMIISDQIELKSMVDGETYTSKSALRRSYRERGYVEIGNEEQKIEKPKPDRKAIRNAVGKAMNRAGISV
jgi:hypothetical protein